MNREDKLIIVFVIGVLMATIPFFGPFPTYLDTNSPDNFDSFGTPILFLRILVTMIGLVLCGMTTVLYLKRVMSQN
ncbi:hypothetical protein SAMN05216388_105712 [Halorientalis persicus]|uniref:Uncharacterized protein n=1 Tax=Halorientalis persicus TaxID=1367881 RepID=A0A1H8WFE2_9EURY|nr:hypothetical protein SAMN05216388_105712 [Halorientalis persicus]